MSITVWDEHHPRPGHGVDQCSECGYLMGLAWGGVHFPLGVNTDAERDALTEMEHDRELSRRLNKPMFPLLDDASTRRYGVRLRTVSGTTARATDPQLIAALSTPGNLVVLPGTYASLAYGHALRARARQGNGSDYTDGHMVAVVNDGGKLGWLDPLRTSGEAPYPCTVGDAMAFAWSNSDAHVVRHNEFAGLPDTGMEDEVEPEIIERIQGEKATLIAGMPLLHEPTAPQKLEPYYIAQEGDVIYPYASVRGLAYRSGGAVRDDYLAFVASDPKFTPPFTVRGYVAAIYAKRQKISGGAAARRRLRQVRTALGGARQGFDASDQALAAAEAAAGIEDDE